MNNKEFDDIIKKKLESLNNEGSVDDWDVFKEKWDNETTTEHSENEQLSKEDQDLEDRIKTNMQKLRIPFNSEHWIILKEQLELEALFKKKLFVAKSVELLILAFLVISILNLWPIQNDIYQMPVYDSPMVASIPVDKETAKKHKAQEEAELLNQNNAKKQIYSSTKELIERTVYSLDKLAIDPLPSSLKMIFIKNSINPKTPRSIEYENYIHTLDFQLPFINNLRQKNDKEQPQEMTESEVDSKIIAPLQQNEIYKLEVPSRPIGFPDISLATKNLQKEENTYLSFALGPKMNLINSPFDPVYDIDPYNIINTNFNISAKVNKEFGPIELFAGLGYTNTSYVPRIVDETYEPRESEFNVARLKNIKFKTFNVPLGVRYNLLDSKKFQIYTKAAVEMNIIAKSEYIIQDTPLDSRSQPAGPPAEYSKNNEANVNSKLSQKEFNKGIFSGGSLKDNLYATASVGFGLGWNLSSKSGIFVEPRYAHFISSKGLGPNADKVHSLSIDLGFRYQLN
jgi:hypothetical protein